MHKYVQPQVFMIAETRVNDDEMNAMLTAVGVPDWYSKHWNDRNPQDEPETFSDAESLIEISGRMCYKSFDLELNKNLTRIREGNKEYIANILKSRHGSVLEHASVTFALIGVSRIITHELVRHRAGTAFSQESGRFVQIESMRFYYPDSYGLSDTVKDVVDEHLTRCALMYKELANKLLKDDLTFHEKKKITSALRRLMPDGACTDIVVTANHRSWRHMIEVRTSDGAEEEIRKVYGLIADKLFEGHKHLYQDMVITYADGLPVYQFENQKV